MDVLGFEVANSAGIHPIDCSVLNVNMSVVKTCNDVSLIFWRTSTPSVQFKGLEHA